MIAFLTQVINAILLLSLILVFIATWKKTGVWFHPSSLMSIGWFIFIGIPFFVGLDHPINPIGTLYITIFVFLFTSTTFLFTWKPLLYKFHKNKYREEILSSRIITWSFFLSATLSTVTILLDATHQGFSLSTDLFTIAGDYAERRYSGTLNPNIYAKIGLLTSFQAVIFGGIVVGTRISKSSKTIVIAAAFTPAIMVMLLQSAKGLFFLSTALFFGGWLITRLHKSNYYWPRIPILNGTLIIFAVLALVITSFIARIGLDAEMLRYYLASYSSGHIYAFSEWISTRYFDKSSFNSFDQPALQAGFYTFMGIFQALGENRPVPLGIYDEYFTIPGFLETNIYTIFRGLISDFGLLGSLLFGAVIGSFSNAAFYILLKKKYSPLACTIFIYLIGFTYQSYIISSFTWISIPASFCITYLILLANKFYLFNPTFPKFLQESNAH